jgi:polysaccharide biosynthesis protein PslG
MRAATRSLLALALLLLAAAAGRPAAAQAPGDPRFFAETGFRIDNDAFWSYFHARGGIANFGYPVSRAFTLRGTPVQIFQRRVLQLGGDGAVGQLNLLDPGLMPYTSFNQAIVPAPDPAVIGAAPPATDAEAVLAFARQLAPDSIGGRPVRFFSTFQSTVPLSVAFPFGGGSPGLLLGIDLEMWGVPTSRPAADPNNANFVYQRWQRGIMHYDLGCNCTQGILLGDYFKSILTGRNLPADLAAQAAGSPFLRQYNNARPGGLSSPAALPGTDLRDAFEPQAPTAPPPQGRNGLRYGYAVYMPFQDQARILGAIRTASFGWLKHQIRWADFEPSPGEIRWQLLDPIADGASASGLGVLFSVVSSPPWARADGRTDGPPDDNDALAIFVAQLARRYQGKVQAYEIWNEQNFSREWGGRPISAGDYVELLRAVHSRVKAVDPAIVVVSGALTPTGYNDPTIAVDDALYLDQMYRYRAGLFRQVADAVGVHAAGYNNPPQDYVGQSSLLVPCHSPDGRLTGTTDCFKSHGSFYFRRIDDLHAIAERNRDGRPFWITEYEWGAADPPVPIGYEWTLDLSEAQVATFYVQGIQMIQAERPWVQAVFAWNLNFRVFQDYHIHETAVFGVLNPNWTPRQIYTRLAQMAK